MIFGSAYDHYKFRCHVFAFDRYAITYMRKLANRMQIGIPEEGSLGIQYLQFLIESCQCNNSPLTVFYSWFMTVNHISQCHTLPF